MNPADWPPIEGVPPDTLEMWTLYDHPLDYPGFWVVRRWFVMSGSHVADVVPRLAQSLAEARSLVPWGKYRQPRFEGDDPFIVETWF